MARPLTELTLIDLIQRSSRMPNRTHILLGIGDDCAILRPPSSHDLLVTTDFTLEGRHFRRDTHSPESAGHRTLARGLSDLAAMGATPLAAFLSLALPGPFLRTKAGKQWFTRFLAGLQRLAGQHTVSLAGGDTAESPSEHILADVVLIGTAPRGRALRRSAAAAGDLLYVTGKLGGAAAELETLLARPGRLYKLGVSGRHPQLYPEPRLLAGRALLRRKLATACIDLSDGLSTDLMHLCRASHLDAEIDADSLPLHPLALRSGHAQELALHGGEDYELLFSASPLTRIPRALAGSKLTRIGVLLPARASVPRVTLVSGDGGRARLAAAGWEHFAARSRPARRLG